MSLTQEKRFPIGVGQVYWNNVRLGSPKAEVTLMREEDMAFHKPGDEMGDSASHLVAEREFVECQISDVKIEQYRFLIGIAKSLESAGSLDSATTSMEHRKVEDIKFTVDSMTLSETSISDVVISSLDYETEYALTTDYLVTSATGVIARVTAGSIVSNTNTRIAYNFTDASSAVMKVGGNRQKFEAELRVAIEGSDNKQWDFIGHRAIRDGGLDITSNETDYSTITVRFKLLHDLTKPRGEQLHYFGLEA